MWRWDDFSGDSGSPELPLLLSIRSQSLVLSALQKMQFVNQWDEPENWDDIDSAIAEALHEIMSAAMPDFMPVGSIVAWAGTIATIPEKWHICDGTLLDVDDYPDLRAALDTPFDNNVNLTVPDLRDRFIYGMGTGSTLGATGGAATVALAINELPAHTHTVGMRNVSAGAGALPVRAGGSAAEGNATTSSVGSGAAHQNLPPYMRLFYIMKVLP